MRKTVTLLVALAATLLLAAPASAVQFGTFDGNGHPQVGVIAFFNAAGAPFRRCTGTLISPTRVLTAAHCTAGTASARVWFDPFVPANPFVGGVTGTPHTMPGFGLASFPATRDLGIVELDVPQAGPFATLAPAGYLDDAKNGSHSRFDVVGYGLQYALPPIYAGDLRARFTGQVQLQNTRNVFTAGYNIQVSAAPGTGGALCRGDSGGPLFVAGTTTIVAVVSLGANDYCMGNSYAYRTDRQDSRAFINGPLP